MATTGTPGRPINPPGREDAIPERRTPSPPGGGGKGSRRRRPTVWSRIKAVFQFFFLLILIAALAVIAFLFFLLKQHPKPVDIKFNPPGRTEIYSSDGVPLASLFVENRKEVKIDQIPKDLRWATIDFEDKRFYEHKGVDIIGIGRALSRNLRHGDLKGEGGSTITQQLARNLGAGGLTREKSFQRKLNEWVIANQIEKTYTKDQILEMYLNDVYYGSGSYGVEAASETYFGKPVDKLDLAQCALLAGLPNRPYTFDPYKYKKAAEAQRNIVLAQMLDSRHITPAQCSAAQAQPVKLAQQHAPRQGSRVYHAPFFVDYVVSQMRHKYGPDFLKSYNLKVTTTLNWGMQQVAEQAIHAGLQRSNSLGPNQACLIAMDHQTGEIKAMVGGKDYNESQFNITTQGRRQPGSLFKAVVYSTAIETGLVTEDTTVYDGPKSYRTASGWWTPKDDNGYSYRSRTLRDAMANSINVPAVKVLELLGPKKVIPYAQAMGIQSPLDPVLSLALGSSAVTPLEMLQVYATIADGGNHAEPLVITHVEDPRGAATEDIAPEVETHIFGHSTMQQVGDMLRAVVEGGTGAAANVVPNAHGKTGTTQGHKDVWFIGYTGDLTCAVWAGHPVHHKKTNSDSYGDTMGGNAWGATVCVPIWTEFMQGAEPIFHKARLKEAARAKVKTIEVHKPAAADSDKQKSEPGTKPADKPAQPDIVRNSDGTVTVNIDDGTGLLAPAGAANSHHVIFEDGQQPTTLAPSYTRRDEMRPRHKTGSHSWQDSAPAADNAPPPPPDDTPTPPDDGTSPAAGSVGAPDPNADPAGSAPPDNGAPPETTYTPVVRHAAAPPPPPPPKPKPKPVYVTVTINPEDGLRATKWCPEVVTRTYLKGTEPKRYSNMYAPPPGER